MNHRNVWAAGLCWVAACSAPGKGTPLDGAATDGAIDALRSDGATGGDAGVDAQVCHHEIYTAPEMKPGFPTELGNQGSTFFGGRYVVVGDVLGDAQLEVVANPMGRSPTVIGADGLIRHTYPTGPAHVALGRLVAGSDRLQVVLSPSGGPWPVAYDGTARLVDWASVYFNFLSSPAAMADVTGDGVDELFPNSEDSRIHGLDALGRELPGYPFASLPPESSQIVAAPMIADLDDDGAPEMVVQSGASVTVMKGDGTTAFGTPRVMPCLLQAIGDTDGDGALQLVGSSLMIDVCLLDRSGTLVQRIPLDDELGTPPAVVLADLDGDRVPEIVAQTYRKLWVKHFDGTAYVDMPGWPQTLDDTPFAAIFAAPAVGDLDGDGHPEIATTTLLGDNLGTGQIWAFHADGTPVPCFPKTGELQSALPPAIADLDLDNRNELIVLAETEPQARLIVYDLGGPAVHAEPEWGQYGRDARHTRTYPLPPVTR